MEDRLFGLDVQLLFDAFVLFVVIMIMYAIMSRLFFKPVRAFLEQRSRQWQQIERKHSSFRKQLRYQRRLMKIS